MYCNIESMCAKINPAVQTCMGITSRLGGGVVRLVEVAVTTVSNVQLIQMRNELCPCLT